MQTSVKPLQKSSSIEFRSNKKSIYFAFLPNSPNRHLIALFVLFCFPYCFTAIAKFPLRSKSLDGRAYLYVNDVATYYGLKTTKSDDHILLWNQINNFEFDIGRRKAYINDVRFHLSFAPRGYRNTLLLSEQDLLLQIDPIFRNSALPNHRIKRVLLDPGHGGKDKGAIGKKFLEKDLNLKLANSLRLLLKGKGYDVKLTRENDRYISLTKRGEIAKSWSADLFISIHCNAAKEISVSGIETFFVTPVGSPSTSKNRLQKTKVAGNSFNKLNTRLAYEIQRELVKSTGANGRGIKHYRWQVLREASCPAVLVEVGFLSNPTEEAKLGDSKYRERITSGILKGILHFQKPLQP